MDEASVGKYSWGSTTLVYLYRQLGQGSRQRCKQLAECLTLLHAWIYEYFLAFRPNRGRLLCRIGDPSCSQWDVHMEPNTPARLVAIYNKIDNMTADQVCWLPFQDDFGTLCPRTMFTGFIQHQSIIEPYMPYICLRQLNFMQGIPPRIPTPISVYRLEDPRHYYVKWPPTSVKTIPISNSLNPCALDYSEFANATKDGYDMWFETYSHPYIVNDKDLIPNTGPNTTIPEHWMSSILEDPEVLWDPLIDELPECWDRLRLGLVRLRKGFDEYETRGGIRRRALRECPPSWGVA